MIPANLSDPHINNLIQDLLNQMSLEEKISLLTGTGFQTTPIPRLNIPALKMTDGPSGVRHGLATAFPAPVALASTWDPNLVTRVGAAMAREARAHGFHCLLAPCINLHRLPIGGRNFESFGEDPLLAGKMGAAMIRGIQSQGVAASLKHFACNNQEWLRTSLNVLVSERALREHYLKGFEIALTEAKPWTIMGAYNRVNGSWACENKHLIQDILKGQWGFDGLFISDWGAARDTVRAFHAGLDLEMPRPKHFHPDRIKEALADNLIQASDLDDKISRFLRLLGRVGLLPGYPAPSRSSTEPDIHRPLAFESAAAGIVLLKNKQACLPLDPHRPQRVAVIGPNARPVRSGGGGSSKVRTSVSVSVLEGLRTYGSGSIEFCFAPGCPIDGEPPVIEPIYLSHIQDGLPSPGLLAQYYPQPSPDGTPGMIRIDPLIDFNWGFDPPDPTMELRDELPSFFVRWQGRLKVPVDGTYRFLIRHSGGVKLTLNGTTLITSHPEVNTLESRIELTDIILRQGHVDIKLEYTCLRSLADIQLGWQIPGSNPLQDAMNLARSCDTAVVCIGLGSRQESEIKDRSSLSLTLQNKLVSAVSAANPRTVVVIIAGTPIEMGPWIDEIPAVIQAWYGGQEGSAALAAVLFGKVNPSGKLPCTIWPNDSDYPGMQDYPQHEPTAHYQEGLFTGYRHVDRIGIRPLFPFGHGLSYTRFHFSTLILTRRDEYTLSVCVTVHNLGKRAGSEVVMVFGGPLPCPENTPAKKLLAFKKTHLYPGEACQIELCIPISDLASYNTELDCWQHHQGPFQIWAGSSSQCLPLSGIVYQPFRSQTLSPTRLTEVTI